MKYLRIFDFHFVINDSLKARVEIISKLLNLSLSKTIIFIIENLIVLTNKIHFLYKIENCYVEKVNWNSHIHVYFKKEKRALYNQLKSIHKDNDTYSIAGKLRYLIKVFIKGVDIYGLEKFLDILENSKKRWMNKFKFKKIFYKKNNMRQLSQLSYLKIQYDIEFTINFIKLLN